MEKFIRHSVAEAVALVHKHVMKSLANLVHQNFVCQFSLWNPWSVIHAMCRFAKVADVEGKTSGVQLYERLWLHETERVYGDRLTCVENVRYLPYRDS